MRNKTRAARGNRQKGSTLIETALCFLAFFTLAMGAVEFGIAVYAYNFCAYASQDAARWASVHGSQSSTPATLSSVTSYVQSEAVALDPSLLTVNATWSPNNNPGSTVQVTVGYTFNPLTGLATKQPINMASTAQFVINH